MTNQPTPDVETVAGVLEAHQTEQLWKPGGWAGDTACSCGWRMAMWSRKDFPAVHRAHVAAVLEPLIREREAKALEEAARHLPERTEGALRIGTELWPECDRDTYSLAIEEAQTALRDRAAEHRETP